MPQVTLAERQGGRESVATRSHQLVFKAIKGFAHGRVPPRPHPLDYVDCEDTSEPTQRGDVTETDDGLFYANPDNCFACEGCGGYISWKQNGDYEGYCDSCHSEYYVKCHGCNEYVARDDYLISEAGDSYCDTCYGETFIHCDNCGEETYADDARSSSCAVYCQDCYNSSSEFDTPCHWSGKNDYSEIVSRRKYGIELETSEAKDYGEWLKTDSWGVKTDGSISGMEFVSAPLYGDDGLAAIRDLCRGAKRSHFELDDKCGFHLHCDLSDTGGYQRKTIALAYHYTRKLWHEFIDPKRYDAEYCMMNTGERQHFWGHKECIDGDDKPFCGDRYVWCNWRAFDKHGTVEIRSHHATLDGDEVCNWVKAHTRFIDHIIGMTTGEITRLFGGEDTDNQFSEFEHMWDDDNLSAYYVNRRIQYSNN